MNLARSIVALLLVINGLAAGSAAYGASGGARDEGAAGADADGGDGGRNSGSADGFNPVLVDDVWSHHPWDGAQKETILSEQSPGTRKHEFGKTRRDTKNETLPSISENTKKNYDEITKGGSRAVPFSPKRLEKMIEKAILKIITGDLSKGDMLLLESFNYTKPEILAIREHELSKRKLTEELRKEERLKTERRTRIEEEYRRKKQPKRWNNREEYVDNFSSQYRQDKDFDDSLEEEEELGKKRETNEKRRKGGKDFDFEEYNRQAVIDYENLASKMTIQQQSWFDNETLLDYEDNSHPTSSSSSSSSVKRVGYSKERDNDNDEDSTDKNAHKNFDKAMEQHVIFKIRYDDSELDSTSDESKARLTGIPYRRNDTRQKERSSTYGHGYAATRNTGGNSFLGTSFDNSSSPSSVPLRSPLPVIAARRHHVVARSNQTDGENSTSDIGTTTTTLELRELLNLLTTTSRSTKTSTDSTGDELSSTDKPRIARIEPIALTLPTDESKESRTKKPARISEYEGLEWVEDDVYRVIPSVVDSLDYDDEHDDDDDDDSRNNRGINEKEATFDYRNPMTITVNEMDNDEEYQNDFTSEPARVFVANGTSTVDGQSTMTGNRSSYQERILAHRRDQSQRAIEDIKSKVLMITRRFNVNNSMDGIQRERLKMFLPTCQVPRNTDLEAWMDPYSMNMNFQLNFTSSDHVVAAKLRIYKLPQENLTSFGGNNGGDGVEDEEEDEKKIRISVYYYKKSLKRHRAKKRLMDSIVTPLTPDGNHLALNVKQGFRLWIQDPRNTHRSGSNHGLVIQVEDQDGRPLKPALYIQEPSCSDVDSNEKAYQRLPALFVKACARYVRNVSNRTETYVNCSN